MPLVAKRNGAKMVIINRDPTPYDHSADIVIHGLAGPTMASILEKVHSVRSELPKGTPG
jgi:NAD-dependent deacetylase